MKFSNLIKKQAVSSRIHFPVGGIYVSFLQKRVHQFWGPPSRPFDGNGGKMVGAEVNQSLPLSAKVKSKWMYTSTPAVCLHGVEREDIFWMSCVLYLQNVCAIQNVRS